MTRSLGLLVLCLSSLAMEIQEQETQTSRTHRATAVDPSHRDVASRRMALQTKTRFFDNYGIANTFEIYSGTHVSAVADRFQNHVLPFFNKNL